MGGELGPQDPQPGVQGTSVEFHCCHGCSALMFLRAAPYAYGLRVQLSYVNNKSLCLPSSSKLSNLPYKMGLNEALMTNNTDIIITSAQMRKLRPRNGEGQGQDPKAEKCQGINPGLSVKRGFPGGSEGKESACNAGDLGSIPGSGRSLVEGNGYSLQYSCLRNSMDREAWRATVHGVTKSWT